MAEKISESSYQAMMEALYNFSGRTNTLASEMQTLANVVNSALGDEDNAVAEIYKQVRTCTLRYNALSKQAMALASDMETELECARKERDVWGNDD